MRQFRREQVLAYYRQLVEKMMVWEQHPRWSQAINFMRGQLESYMAAKQAISEVVVELEKGESFPDEDLDYFVSSAKQFLESSEYMLSQFAEMENAGLPERMRLYKYVAVERLNVLTNGHIRFTQHEELNDPLDLFPFVEAVVGEGEMPNFVAGLEQTFKDRTKPENAVGNITDILLNAQKAQGQPDLTGEEQERLRASLEQIFQQHPEYAEGFNKLYGVIARAGLDIATLLLPGVDRDVAQKVPQMLNEAVGILSLSERPDQAAMWAHYAGGHTGFVIEFDSGNPFFHYPSRPGISALKPMRYEERRAIQSLVAETSSFEDLFFVKTPDWSYEQEWRLVRLLENADKVMGKIHLFAFPPACITSVILGMKMEKKRQRKLISLLKKDLRYKHVAVYQAVLDSKTGYIRFNSVDS